MATKDEFYQALTKLGDAAKDVLAKMPPELGERDVRLWRGLLTRLPEQIADMKSNLDDPYLNARSEGRNSGIIV